jgi:phosphatidylglycerophosphate synthase
MSGRADREAARVLGIEPRAGRAGGSPSARWVLAGTSLRIIVGREMAVLGLRGSAAAEGTVFPPSPGGRIKAAMQFVALFLAILRPGDPVGPAYLDEWALLAAAVVTVATAVDYFARFAWALRRSA